MIRDQGFTVILQKKNTNIAGKCRTILDQRKMVERVIIVDVQTINLLTLCVPIKNFLQLDISFFS